MSNLKDFHNKHPGDNILNYFKYLNPIFYAICIAAVYAAITMYITIHLMHDSFHTAGFDLGIFTQDLKYTLQGKILYSTAGEYQLAHHFSPVLFLLVPVYWLFPHAQTLLVVQALVLAFGGYLISQFFSKFESDILRYFHRGGLCCGYDVHYYPPYARFISYSRV